MLKILVFAPMIFAAFIVFKSGSMATNAAAPTQKLGIELDKTRVANWCPWNDYCPKEGARVRVKSKGIDKQNSTWTYYYSGSCGLIEGSGGDVVWDLSACSSGRYTITVAVGTGRVLND